VKKNLNPTWKEMFFFDLAADSKKGNQIFIEVVDTSGFSEAFCGQAIIDSPAKLEDEVVHDHVREE
tara:strand:- start:382 stop:579 length:198 start_codon:yes stop_codon:yes gene_type:complete